MDSSVQPTSPFQCEGCRQPFKDPRMLPTCLHTLCHSCLKICLTYETEDGQRQCPVTLCKATFQAPKDGTRAFPKDVFLAYYKNVLVDGEKEASQTSLDSVNWIDMKCCNAGDEDECPTPEQFCVDCGEYYCDDCCTVHLKIAKKRKGKTHNVLKAIDLSEELLVKSLIKSRIPTCLDHGKKVKFYCSTCRRPAGCSICCLDHKDHKLEQIANGDETNKRVLHEGVTKLQTVIEDMEAQVGKCAQEQEETTSAFSSATKKAQNIFAMVSRSLEKEADKAERAIEQELQDARDEAAARKENLVLHIDKLRRLLSSVECLVDNGSVFNRLALCPRVGARLKPISPNSLDRKEQAFLLSPGDILVQQLDGLSLEENINLDDSGDRETDRILNIEIRFRLQQDKKKQDKSTQEEETRGDIKEGVEENKGEEEDGEQNNEGGYQRIEIMDEGAVIEDPKETQEGDTESLYQRLDSIIDDESELESSISKFQASSVADPRLETNSDLATSENSGDKSSTIQEVPTEEVRSKEPFGGF